MKTRSPSTRNPLEVKRADCLPENRDLNFGNPTFGPFRFPDTDWKKLVNACSASRMDWIRATDDTLLSQGFCERWWVTTAACRLASNALTVWSGLVAVGLASATSCRPVS